MIAVDTNVLVYAVDANETEKGAKAIALLDELQSKPTVLLWQVVCEFGAVMERKKAKSTIRVDVGELASAWMDLFPLALPTRAVATKAWELKAAHQMSYWDSMLLAACVDAGVQTLYTEDLPGQSTIAGVRCVNPFATRV